MAGRGEGVLHREFGWLVEGLEYAATLIDLLGILLLLVGAVRFVLGVVQAELSREETRRLRGLNRERIELGRYILAGLELLIVSDIIHTSLSLAFADLFYLGLLVLIRSLISFFLHGALGQGRRERGDGGGGDGR